LFFSSRRRHTRCYRDWSSDVCSSDLNARIGSGVLPMNRRPVEGSWPFRVSFQVVENRGPPHPSPLPKGEGIPPRRCPFPFVHGRSEERRVGKECRCEWCMCCW